VKVKRSVLLFSISVLHFHCWRELQTEARAVQIRRNNVISRSAHSYRSVDSGTRVAVCRFLDTFSRCCSSPSAYYEFVFSTLDCACDAWLDRLRDCVRRNGRVSKQYNIMLPISYLGCVCILSDDDDDRRTSCERVLVSLSLSLRLLLHDTTTNEPFLNSSTDFFCYTTF